MPWLFAETNSLDDTQGFLYDTVDSGWLTVETPTVEMPYLWWTPQSYDPDPAVFWWNDNPAFSGDNESYLEDLTFFKFTEYENDSVFSYLVLPKLEVNPFIPLTDGSYVYSENNDPASNLEEIFEQILDPNFTIASIDNSLTEELTVLDLLPSLPQTSDGSDTDNPSEGTEVDSNSEENESCSEELSNISVNCSSVTTPVVETVPEYSSILTFVLLGTAFCCGLFRQGKR